MNLFTGAYLQRGYHGRYYAKAQNVRYLLTRAYDAALGSHDCRDHADGAFPCAAATAPGLLDRAERGRRREHGEQYLPGEPHTGHPSMIVPCSIADGLPIGMMISGRHFDDSSVIAAAAAFENVGDWRTM